MTTKTNDYFQFYQTYYPSTAGASREVDISGGVDLF